MDLTSIIALLHDPAARYLIIAAAVFWLFSALLHTMPAPTEKSGVAYQWAYRFLQLVGANLDRVKRPELPTISNK